MKRFGMTAVTVSLLATLAWAPPAAAYEWTVDIISVMPGTSVTEGTSLGIKCYWSRSGTAGVSAPGVGQIRGIFNGQSYVIQQYPNLSGSAPGGDFVGVWVAQGRGKHKIQCRVKFKMPEAYKDVEVTVRPGGVPQQSGNNPPAAFQNDSMKTTPLKLAPGALAQRTLKVLDKRKVGADLETVLEFSKDDEEAATIRTKAEPERAADDVVVSGRSGLATVRVRDVCATRAGSTLHLMQELVVTYAFPAGGSVTLPLGGTEQHLPLAELCGAGLPAPKKETLAKQEEALTKAVRPNLGEMKPMTGQAQAPAAQADPKALKVMSPDLSVKSIAVHPVPLKAGTPVNLEIAFENKGSKASGPDAKYKLTCTVLKGGPECPAPSGERTIGKNIEPGQTGSVILMGAKPAAAGEYGVSVAVPPDQMGRPFSITLKVAPVITGPRTQMPDHPPQVRPAPPSHPPPDDSKPKPRLVPR